MALFNFKTPNEILAERNKSIRESALAAQASQGGLAGVGTAVGGGLGNFGLALLREAGLEVDPELQQAEANQSIYQSLQKEGFDSTREEDLLRAATKFQEAGNLEQAASLRNRALELRGVATKQRREQVKEDLDRAKLAEQQAENRFRELTKNLNLGKASAQQQKLLEEVKRLQLQNARREQGLSPDAPAQTEASLPRAGDINSGVDAVLERAAQQSGVDLKSEGNVLSANRDRLRSATRDILAKDPSLSPEQAAEQAFARVYTLEEASTLFGIPLPFTGGVTAKESPLNTQPQQAAQQPTRRRVTFQ